MYFLRQKNFIYNKKKDKKYSLSFRRNMDSSVTYEQKKIKERSVN